MNELIIHYYHGDTSTCQVRYRTNRAIQKSERFPFIFNISKEDRKLIQWYLEEYRIYPYDAFQYRAKQTERMMCDIGTALFNEIFHNKEEKAQDAIRFYNRVMKNPTTCHILIQSDHVTGWSLPWELLYEPANGYLAQKVAGFVRSQPDTQTHLKPIRIKDNSKINILMVVSRPYGDEEKVPFQSMARPLLKIFRSHMVRIHVDLLRPPTFEKLQQVLSKKENFYHILHFDGHGEFSPSIRDNSNTFLSEEEFPGKLAFRKTGGGADLVSGAKLGQLLSGKGMPIVILNACQSGMTDPEALYPSVGGELIKTGALGVVAMSYSVYVDTAVEFMKVVYESLINGKTLSRAVRLARNALAVQDKRDSPIGLIPLQDWIVPVLFKSKESRLISPSGGTIKPNDSINEGKSTDVATEINLPGEPDYDFIGRDTDILKLEESFENETIVLLQAMAGVGKSATAIGFARWWKETGALQGSIFFFSFESYTTLMQICNCIGSVFREKIKAKLKVEWHFLDKTQRIRETINILRQIRCLLIWDNFESVTGFPTGTPSNWKEDEQEDLKEFLKALDGGATKVILTSRIDERWLGSCYKRLDLQGLNFLDTMKLAGRILDEAKINRRTLKPYHKLLKYLQGNPLAIQVILPELARLEPEALLTKLQTGEAKLSEDDKSQDRQHSLTASLSFGLDKLDKLLLSQLSVLSIFKEFVTVNTLSLICDDKEAPKILQGIKQNDWQKMLEQTAQMGLLQKARLGFYRIHPAFPWFFHKMLYTVNKKDIKILEKRFVTRYGQLGNALQTLLHIDEDKAMSYFHLEEQNFKYGIKLGVDFKMWNAVFYIFMLIVETLGRVNRWTESELLTLEIKRKATDNKGTPLFGTEDLCIALWHHLGIIANERQQFTEAEEWYRQSLALSKKLKDEHGQAATLFELGEVSMKRQQFTEAEKWYIQSLALSKKLKDEYGQLIVFCELGVIAQKKKKFTEAEEWYIQSLALSKKLKDEYGQAATLFGLGEVSMKRQQFTEAKQWFLQSLALSKKLKDEYRQTATLNMLGIIAYKRQQFTEAEQWYCQSLALNAKQESKYDYAYVLVQLGNIALGKQQFDEAEKWYIQSLALSKKLKDEYGQAATLNMLGIIGVQKKKYTKAEQWFRQSLALSKKLKYGYGQACSLNQLGLLAYDRQQFNQAEKLYLEAESISKKCHIEQFISLIQDSLKIVRDKKERNRN